MNRELIMQTLFARLQTPPLVYKFTADLSAGNDVLTSVSDASGLLLGMPISGSGIAEGTVLAALDPDIRLSKLPTLSDTAVALTQGLALPTRILQPIGEISATPALCLVEGSEVYPSASAGSPRAPSNQPQLITLEPYAWLYASSPDPTTVPNAIINVLLDAIDTVLLPTDGTSWQNLGLTGVHHARVEGRLLRAAGSAGTVSARIQFGIQILQGYPIAPLL